MSRTPGSRVLTTLIVGALCGALAYSFNVEIVPRINDVLYRSAFKNVAIVGPTQDSLRTPLVISLIVSVKTSVLWHVAKTHRWHFAIWLAAFDTIAMVGFLRAVELEAQLREVYVLCLIVLAVSTTVGLLAVRLIPVRKASAPADRRIGASQ